VACIEENHQPVRRGYCECSNVAHTNMVHDFTSASNKGTVGHQQQSSTLKRNDQTTPTQPKDETSRSIMFQRYKGAAEISTETTKILSAAWRPKTERKYKGIIKSFVAKDRYHAGRYNNYTIIPH